MVPNYAYGQDVGNGFKQYYAQLVPDGEIVDEQFPEFDEDDFTPFINAMLAEEPRRDPDRVLLVVHAAVHAPVEGERQRRARSRSSRASRASTATRPASRAPTRSRQNWYGYDRGN